MLADAYLDQLLALLPPGAALVREPGSPLVRVLGVTAAELARVDARAEQLLLEADPQETAEMLSDWERALGLPDICNPNFRLRRASTATYFDGALMLREAAVDEPRYLFDTNGARTDGIIVEGASTNFIANPRAEFAGSLLTSTVPIGWTRSAPGGWVWETVGAGVEDGIPYIDLRLYTPTTGNQNNASINVMTGFALSAGETWTFTAFARLLSGDISAFTSRMFIGTMTVPQALVANPTAAALRTQRFQKTFTITATQAAATITFALATPPNGSSGDVTIRLALPQLERASAPSSPIVPPVGTQAASGRAADDLFVATVAERRRRLVARLVERFEPRPASFVTLAAQYGDTVTVTEFRPHDCEKSCEDEILDEAWAHAFRITGTASLAVEFTCLDGCETPLQQWRTGAYECAMRRFAPAQTVPIFAYT